MKKTKKFDLLETKEAMEYFSHRFSSKDVTISRSGPFIRVGVGDVHGPEFVITKEPGGWLVWKYQGAPPVTRARTVLGHRIVVKAARSYERAAIAIEKDMGW